MSCRHLEKDTGWKPTDSARAVATNTRDGGQLGGVRVKEQTVISHRPGGWKPEIRVPASVLGEGTLPGSQTLPCCILTGLRVDILVFLPLIPSGGSTLMAPSTPLRPHWAQGFNIWIWGRPKHLVYNTRPLQIASSGQMTDFRTLS